MQKETPRTARVRASQQASDSNQNFLGLMTDAGRAVLPKMGPRSFRIDPEVEAALKKARVWTAFRAFPPLYQRIRAYNVAFYRQRDEALYHQSLDHLIRETRKHRMYGEWNDYGRLLEE